MRHYDDETLGAYIDGELDRETVKALEADLRKDPDLRRQVTELRAISTALREWCTEQVRPQAAAWPFAMLTDKQSSRFQRALRGFTPLWSHALAASVALLFGVSIGQFVNHSGRQHGGGADEAVQQLLQSALEHTMSGQEISWTDNASRHTVTVQPIRTYRASGTFCREYRETAINATQPNERTMYGLACRSPEGTWSVEYTLAPGARSLLANQ
ncbi:MAG TPA: RT0821/Lpp0805 family surface protein [Acetobacteraceae bacterium]|jgi:surface antigen|nr:RT0821/Lpp0805 family surface protein [Acetobacteraceae bacterium]